MGMNIVNGYRSDNGDEDDESGSTVENEGEKQLNTLRKREKRG